MEIRVAIFEDNKELLSNLEQLVDSSELMVCTGAFLNADRVIQKIHSAKPDVVLMDIQLPGISGIEAVKQIKAHFPDISILMQTVFEDNDKIFASVCAGASGYILKKTIPSRILEAIVETHNGNTAMSPSIAARVLQMFRVQESPSKYEIIELTLREKEILQWLVQGKSYKFIAFTCFISIDTVSTHIRHIYEKLQVHSKSEAVAKAIFQKLI